MMDEYINRKAVISLFDADKWQGQICIDAIRELFASDVAPVVHGVWTNPVCIKQITKNSSIAFCKCSVCGKTRTRDNFCSNCGAKMDLQEEQQ